MSESSFTKFSLSSSSWFKEISTSGRIDFKVVKNISTLSFVRGSSGTTSSKPSSICSISSSSSLFFIKAVKAPVFKERISSCNVQAIFTPSLSSLQGVYKRGVKNSFFLLVLELLPTRNMWPYIRYLSFWLISLCIINSVKSLSEPSSRRGLSKLVKSSSSPLRKIHLLSLSCFRFLKVELWTSSLTQSWRYKLNLFIKLSWNADWIIFVASCNISLHIIFEN